MVDESVEGGVVVERLRISKLFVFIASENVAVMLALGSTPVGGVALAGTVLTATVGAGRAAQAIPAAKSSVTAIVVKSSSVFLMIFLSPPLGVPCTKGAFS